MERLTEWRGEHAAVEDHHKNYIDRLAAYEDTGLAPEEIEVLKTALMGKSLAEIKEINGVPVKRMIELAEAEKEGRLVVLPCAIGDKVYINLPNGSTVCEIVQSITKPEFRTITWGYGSRGTDFDYCEYGRNVFRTREEAEIALKKKLADKYNIEMNQNIVETEAIEVCPYCSEENVFPNWDVNKQGYTVTCQHCGKPMMLCDECYHSEDNPNHNCDWQYDDDTRQTGHCSRVEGLAP